MRWAEIAVATTSEFADIVSLLLVECGAGGTAIEDRADIAAFNQTADWDYIDDDVLNRFGEDVRVKAYFPADRLPATLEAVRLRVAELPEEAGKREISVAQVDEEDWANEWKKYYKPVRAAKRTVVVPVWERYAPQEGDVVVTLDPGMAFGTGTHETTRMCLALLEDVVRPADTCIDVGCGTAVLAILMKKLGAGAVLAIDRDPAAVKSARSNAALNGLALTVREGDLLKDVAPFFADVIAVNIVADVILGLLPALDAFTGPGARLVLSGIISGREEEIERALVAAGYVRRAHLHEGEWHAYLGEKL